MLSTLCVAAPKSRCPSCFAVHPRVSIDGRCTLHFSQCCCGETIDLNALRPSCSVECHPVNNKRVRACHALSCNLSLPKGEVAGKKTTLVLASGVRKTRIYKVHSELHPVTAAVASRGKPCGLQKRTVKTTTIREQSTTQTSGVHPAQHTSVEARIPPACIQQYIFCAFRRMRLNHSAVVSM